MGGEASTDLESSIQSARGSGQSLDANLQRSMGQAMGADFSGVKVHTDSQSDQLNKSIQAKAFTTGQDVFFRQGAYEPSSRGGQELIAHELTHVVQQGNGINRSIQRKDTNIPPLDKDMVSHQLLGSTKTENIQNCINKYNLIANGDPNYDQQLKILGQLLSYVEQWLVKNPLDLANSNSLKIAAIEDIKTKATAEQTRVTDARKQAVDNKILEKNNNTTLGVSSPKFEELSDEYISNILKNNKDVITAQVLSELGVGIGAWRRSKETNEFRQAMKDAARQQAEADISASNNIITTKPSTTSSGTSTETAIGANYQKMMAKHKAQSSAKGAVDKAMEDAAKKITEEFVKEAEYKEALNDESRKAANDMALKFISTDPNLSNSATLKAIEKAKLSAASTKAAELLADNKQKAIEKAKDTQNETKTNRAPLANEVKQKATDMKVGEKALEGVRDSKAIGSTFTGTATTEKIKNSINEYNSIANDTDYDNKLLFLDQLLADANAWLSRYSGPPPSPELSQIQEVKAEAEAKKTAVTDARKLAVERKIGSKSPSASGEKFEDLSDAEIDAILTEHKAVIKAKVLSKLGVGRGARRRSKETNKFRQGMKDTAREQAATDIRSHLPSGGTTPAMTNYKAMVAEVEAYSTSKGSVDAAMAVEAQKITDKFVVKDGSSNYKETLNAKSSKAAHDMALKFISTDPELTKLETQEAIAIAKSSAARTEAKNLLIDQSRKAIADAKAYTHGDTSKDTERLNLNTDVKTRVTSDNIGKNAVNKVITATTLDNGFSRVAGLIDTLLPSNGSIGLNIVLKIKDPQTNVFFITQLKGEATKEQGKEVSLRSELSLGAGWEMFGMSASGQAGFFFDATSTDTNKAVSLISYGLYRRLQTEKLDSTVANTIWGYGGKSQLNDKGEEAETWATAMEEYLFKDAAATGGVNDKSKVDVGMLVKGNAEANLGGVAKGEFEAKYSTAKQYSAASMGITTSNIGTKKAKSSTGLKAALAGKDVSYFDISAAIEAFSGFAGGELSAKFGWDGSTFNSFDLKGAGLLSNALGSDGSEYGETVDKVCKSITAFITSAAASGRNVYNIANAKQGENAETTGQIGSILNNVGTIAVSAGDLTGKEWGKSLVGGEGSQDLVKSTSEVSIMNPLLEFKDNLRVGLTLSWKVGSPPEIKVDISQVKAAKLDTGSAINVVGSFKMEGKITTEIISKKFTL